MKFSIMDFFSKCDQIRRKLRIWSYLLKRSLIENFTFSEVNISKGGNYHHKITDDSKSNHDDAPMEISRDDKTRKEVIFIGDTMLNNINPLVPDVH